VLVRPKGEGAGDECWLLRKKIIIKKKYRVVEKDRAIQ